HAGPSAGPGSVPGQGAPGGDAGAREEEPAAAVRPSPELLGRLVDEVAQRRAKRRRRGLYLAAAAAVLIVGGPTAAVVATSGDHGPGATQAAPAATASSYFKTLGTKYSATDPVTKVSATVAVETKGWGTDAVLELKNVKGPLKCRLVAVSKSGEQEVMTSWAVPEWGYGVPSSTVPLARQPLYVQGGAAVQPKDIDHFDVTTFDGKRLVRVPA
ncbi:RNA polymerase subunit sigma, partial [Streptomyces fuscigenes]|uniref:RNA polymerase subunit sigma n=1 Tax=Streptomyces fuscigenes TaxID=1528880 RepID=UPI001F41ADB3